MKKLLKKKCLLVLLPLLLAVLAVLWFGFAPNFFINSGLTRQRDILENNEQFVLYSLDPSSRYTTGDAVEDRKSGLGKTYEEKFHNYGVLGKTLITDKSTKAKIVEALYGGIEKGGSAGILCFNPRHGIRVVRGGQTVDLVICFQCRSIDVYTNSFTGRVYTSSSPQKVFDNVLKNAKVPLGNRDDE